MMDSDNYALITGSSRGIGKAFAMECASRGINVLLVSRSGNDLEETASLIREKYKVKVDSFPIDLAEKESPQKVYNWCRKMNYTIDILINNAGVGGTASFEESSVEYDDQRIQLNIRALVLMCKLFIPDMKRLKQAYILNVSSLSAFYSIPYKSVYAASKSFVLSFSKSISYELSGSSINVSTVCPNGVYTNEEIRSRINAHGLIGRLTSISTNRLAEISINAMFKAKAVIIPKPINKFLLFVHKITPGKIEQKLLLREFNKEVQASKNKIS